MNVFSIIGIKFLNFIMSILPDSMIDEIPQLNVVDDVLNIFAWINYFLPMPVIIAILAITTGIYSFTFILNIVKWTKDVIL